MEPFVFLLIMAAISFFNWLIKRIQESAEAKKQQGQSQDTRSASPQKRRTTRPVRPQKTEDERLREFMEALGVPKEKLPQPRTQRQQEPPPIPRQAAPMRREVQPPPVPVPPRKPIPVSAPPERQPAPPTVPAAAAAEPVLATAEAASEPQTRDAYRLTAASERASSVPAVEIGRILRTPSGFRSAVLVREILGPPKALRTQEELPGFL